MLRVKENDFCTPDRIKAKVRTVVIDGSVTSIGEYAFHGCSSLESVTIPDSVESIGDEAFSGCTSLTSITIPESVTSIGDWMFVDCTSLTSIAIPESVTSIGHHAFLGCTSLTSVTIPDSVISIGDDAFRGCISLTSVTIPESVTSIGDEAFRGCISLTSIEVDSSNTAYSSEDGVLFDKTKTSLIHYPAEKTARSYTIPDSVRFIGDEAFRGCTSLTSVTIPESVRFIGDKAFCGCTSLTSIFFPSWLVRIDSNIFDECTSLVEIIVPDDADVDYIWGLEDLFYDYAIIRRSESADKSGLSHNSSEENSRNLSKFAENNVDLQNNLGGYTQNVNLVADFDSMFLQSNLNELMSNLERFISFVKDLKLPISMLIILESSIRYAPDSLKAILQSSDKADFEYRVKKLCDDLRLDLESATKVL